MKAIELKKDYRFKFVRSNQVVYFLQFCEENGCFDFKYFLPKSTAWISKECGISFNILIKLAKRAEKKELQEKFKIRQLKNSEYKLTFSNKEKVHKFAKLAQKEFGENDINIATSPHDDCHKRYAAWIVFLTNKDNIEEYEKKLFDLAILADAENFD